MIYSVVLLQAEGPRCSQGRAQSASALDGVRGRGSKLSKSNSLLDCCINYVVATTNIESFKIVHQ